MSKRENGGTKLIYEKTFHEALAKATHAVEVSGLSQFNPVLEAMAAVEGEAAVAAAGEAVDAGGGGAGASVVFSAAAGGGSKQGDCPYGRKPFHTVWFGPPPSKGKPYFGFDTLAASVYAKELAYDKSVQVHFWCLPEWVEHYQEYFSTINEQVKVHSLNELVEDFPEIEAVNHTMANLPSIDAGDPKHQWVMRQIEEAVVAHKNAIREKYRLFDLALIEESDKRRDPQYLQAILALIRDHCLDSRRRSIRDLVSLKDNFVNLMLLLIGGYYFDVSVLPEKGASGQFVLPEPRTFLPIVATYNARVTLRNKEYVGSLRAYGTSYAYTAQADIFCMSLPLPQVQSPIQCSEDRFLIRNRFYGILWEQVHVFSPSSALSQLFPKINDEGQKKYDQRGHSALVDSSSIIVDRLSIRPQPYSKEGGYSSVNQYFLFLVSSILGRWDHFPTDTFVVGQRQNWSPGPIGVCFSNATSCVNKVRSFDFHGQRLSKIFLGTHHNKSSEHNSSPDKALVGYQSFVDRRRGYLGSQQLDAVPSECDGEDERGEEFREKLANFLKESIDAGSQAACHAAFEYGAYGRLLELARDSLISEEGWKFLLSLDDGFDRRRQAIDFILELERQLESPKQPTIFDSQKMLQAKREVRFTLMLVLDKLLKAPKAEISPAVQEIKNYIQSLRDNKPYWDRVVWTWRPGQPSRLGALLAQIEADFGDEQSPGAGVDPAAGAGKGHGTNP